MRILLTRLGGVGDLLFIEPVIRAIYEKYNPCEIVFRTYVDFEGVLDHHPCVSSVVYDTNLYHLGYFDDLSPKQSPYWRDVDPRFDKHFDFQGAVEQYMDNPEIHAVHAFAKKAQIKINNIVPQIHYIKKDAPRYPLVVQLASDGEDRDLSNSQAVLDVLSRHNPLFLGDKKINYNNFVSIINNCDLFVGTESCGVVIARGLNKKAIGLYKNETRIKNRSFDKMTTLSFNQTNQLEKALCT